MPSRKLKIAYWVFTSLFCLFLVMDGVAGAMQVPTGREVMDHLGYPYFLMTLTGVLKVLAAIAILQPRFVTIKEWAFAGYVFTCIGAFWSRAAVGDGVGLLAFPVVFLAFGLIPYVLWKKLEPATAA